MEVTHLTKDEFLKKVANYEQSPEEWKFLGDKSCIIDFYADWCGPCKMVAPILDQLAEKYDGRIDIYKVDTEKEEELSAVFGIRSIPTILFCPKDDHPQILRGAVSKADFEKVIQDVLLQEEENC
ncbi:MAG: thioredoxin [Tannerellaceae bacterium]|nr:thioredoxin [Tannerellaceae bacterium]